MKYKIQSSLVGNLASRQTEYDVLKTLGDIFGKITLVTVRKELIWRQKDKTKIQVSSYNIAYSRMCVLTFMY